MLQLPLASNLTVEDVLKDARTLAKPGLAGFASFAPATQQICAAAAVNAKPTNSKLKRVLEVLITGSLHTADVAANPEREPSFLSPLR